MKYGILSVMALVFACMVYAQDVEAIMADAEKSERDLKETDALNKYKEALMIQPANVKALWRSAELTGRIGSRLKNEDQKAACMEQAKQYAEAALKAAHNDADANYAVAATAMRYAAITKGRDRARFLRDMKYYADSALIINPAHARALYILGKWNFDITAMGAGDKAALKVLFGGMPKASLEDAIQYFEKARAADTFLMIDYLELAKAYVKFHQTDKAIEVLNKMMKLPPRTEDDPSYKAEGKALLASLQ
jgi:tetratricopeptide (TPR) repeat protein